MGGKTAQRGENTKPLIDNWDILCSQKWLTKCFAPLKFNFYP